MSITAHLVYGYDLGGPEEWRIREKDEYGDPTGLDWYDPEDDDDDFAGSVAVRLRDRLAGFTERWTPGDDESYFDRKQAAQARVGVDVVTHCSSDFPSYALITHKITAYRGQVTPVEHVEDQAEEAAANQRLAAALQALGLTPVQDAPRWLLLAYGNR